MSQFGWQIMALKSAELAGVKVHPLTKQRAARFMLGVSSGRHGGLASYRARERPSRTMTAESFCAITCLKIRRVVRRARKPLPSCRKSCQRLDRPTSITGTMAHWQCVSPGASRGSWNQALQQELLGSQRSDGSWEPDRVWGGYGGKVYQTALSALCLEAYYRYDVTSAIDRTVIAR